MLTGGFVMAIGPGKYDAVATLARMNAGAEGVILIVVGGERGAGFSVQLAAELVPHVPELLRNLADEIERDVRRGKL
jgi:hypothetical protein